MSRVQILVVPEYQKICIYTQACCKDSYNYWFSTAVLIIGVLGDWLVAMHVHVVGMEIYSRHTYWDVHVWWFQDQTQQRWFWWLKLISSSQHTLQAKNIWLDIMPYFSIKALIIHTSRRWFNLLFYLLLSKNQSLILRILSSTYFLHLSIRPSTLYARWRRYIHIYVISSWRRVIKIYAISIC